MRSLRSVGSVFLLVGLLAAGCDQGAGEDTTVPSTLPASTTTAAPTTTTAVPVAVVDLGSPDRLADFQAGPLPAAATCPPGSTPDVPFVDTWWWNRPGLEAVWHAQAAFDWESGQLVTDGIWLFDPCRNLWEKTVGPPPGVFGLVYDADSDLVVAFDHDGTVWAYDADTDNWTEKGGMPGASDWALQAVYHDPSGLVVGVGGYGSARRLWAYDVDSDTWYDLGPANLGPGMLGYDPGGDRFYAYVAGDGGAQTWRYEPGQGWTQLAIPTPEFDLDPDPNDDADPAPMAFDRTAGRFVIVDQGVVAALDPSVPEWEIISDPSQGTGPLDRSFQTVVYDPLNGRLIVLGGRYGEDEWADDVWAFDTGSRQWQELLPPVVWPGIVPFPFAPEAAGWRVRGVLTAVSASEVWVADTSGAIGHSDGGVWTSYHLAGGLANFGTSYLVWDLAVAPDGTVWAATGGGVFSFDGVEWTRRFDRPAAIGVAPDGTVWIAPVWDWRLARWDGTTFVALDTDIAAEHPWLSHLAVAANGQIWVTALYGYGGKVLMRYDGATMEEVPIAEDPPGDVFIDIMEAAPNGDLWIVGGVPGDEGQLLPLLARFDGEAWTTYDPPLSCCWSDLALGPDGVVWLSGRDGLASFDGSDWTYHIRGQWVSAVDIAPDGTVWYNVDVGTGDSVDTPTAWYYADDTGVHVHTFDFVVGSMAGMTAPADYLRPLAVSAGEMLAIMDDGLICRLEFGRRRECYGLEGEGVVQGLALAPDGMVWAATTVGVFSFDGADWAWRFPGSAGGIAVAGDGTVWVAGPWGLARADGDSWVVADADPGLRPAEGEQVRLAVAADGAVWMAGHRQGGPLLRYAGTALEEVPIGSGTGDPVWESLWIQEVTASANGDIWVVGSSGPAPDRGPVVVARFDGVEWTAYEWPAQAMASVADVAVGPDGVVWFGTYDGLASFDGSEWTAHIQGRGAWSVDVAPDGTIWYVDDYGAHTFGTP